MSANENYVYARYRTILFDKESRFRKAEKIYLLIKESYKNNLESARILDVGCSAGYISYWLSEKVGHVVGIDIDHDAIDSLNALKEEKENIEFKFACGDLLPFEDASFDVIICNIMYNLMTFETQERMFAEIRRCLRPEGICYFAGVNKFLILERKYNLPFLPWLPHRLGKIYVGMCSKIQGFDEYYRTLFGLKALCSRDFLVEDVSLKVIDNLHHYKMISNKNIAIQFFASIMGRLFYLFIPNYIFILRPRNRSGQK